MMSMVAGIGFEPTSLGYEPSEEPLLHTAMYNKSVLGKFAEQ